MTTENNLYNESNEATYCPEDNKLRLYIGSFKSEGTAAEVILLTIKGSN